MTGRRASNLFVKVDGRVEKDVLRVGLEWASGVCFGEYCGCGEEGKVAS